MLLLGIIIVLLIVSFLWAIYSLKSEMKRHQLVEDAKQELSKGKIIFQASSESLDT